MPKLNVPLLGLALVACAPLLNYISHGALIGTAALGILVLAVWMLATRRFMPAVHTFIQSPAVHTGAALVGLALASWGFSSYMGIHPKCLTDWMRIPLIFLFLILFGMGARQLSLRDHTKVFHILAWMTVIIAVCIIFERYVPDVSKALRDDPRASRLNFTATILVFGFAFTLYQWIAHKQRIWMPLLTLFAIGISNGRIGWFVAPCVMLGYAALTYRKVGLQRWGVMLASGIGALCLGIGGMFMAHSRRYVSARLNDLATGSGEGRLDIWAFALSSWESHPWFGIGVQGFRFLDFSSVNLASTYHPHNALIQLLLETGLIGTLAGIVALTYLLVQGWHNMAHSIHERGALFMCLAGLGGCAMANTSLFHAWWMIFMLIPLAWLLAWPTSR